MRDVRWWPKFLTPTTFKEQSVPSTPASGEVVVYAKADGRLYGKDDAGVEFLLSTDLDLLPWTIPINPYLPADGNTNWATVQTSGVLINNGWLISSGVVNAEVWWEIFLAKGTWSLQFMYSRLVNSGIYTPSIGPVGGASQVDKTTIDSYNATAIYNVVATVDLGVIAASTKYRIRLKMTGKHASSSAYYGAINGMMQLKRTA